MGRLKQKELYMKEMDYSSEYFITQYDMDIIKKFEENKLAEILSKADSKEQAEKIKRHFL